MLEEYEEDGGEIMPTPALNDAEIIESLAKLNGWSREGDKLVKEFKLENYVSGLALATAIGAIAEGLDHHPDIFIGYRKVRVEFSTHDAGHKITHKDFAAAAAIDALKYPRVK